MDKYQLLTDDGKYTEHGEQFENELRTLIEPLLKKVGEYGAKPADLFVITADTVRMYHLEQALGWRDK